MVLSQKHSLTVVVTLFSLISAGNSSSCQIPSQEKSSLALCNRPSRTWHILFPPKFFLVPFHLILYEMATGSYVTDFQPGIIRLFQQGNFTFILLCLCSSDAVCLPSFDPRQYGNGPLILQNTMDHNVTK